MLHTRLTPENRSYGHVMSAVLVPTFWQVMTCGTALYFEEEKKVIMP
ncbi:hypothetical protein L7G72_19675 [Xenorhabdus bovienii]|nr:hypothetical protein [Xenorhabdus bovienii]MCG3463987.1 hypothetical protein [Xenorhabdus bovienii]